MTGVHDSLTSGAQCWWVERVRGASPRALLGIGVLLICAALAASFGLLARSSPAAPSPDAVPSPTSSRLVGQLPSESVAVDVLFDAALGLPGEVSIGDHVDVLAFLSPQVTGDTARTVAVLKDATVLRTARESAAQALTFAVPPEQALVLQQLTQLKAPIFLVLRAPGDRTSADSDTFTDANLSALVATRAP